MNKAILIGNLGRDPEMRFTNSGTACLTLNLATNERRKSGEKWEDHTEWHKVIVWGKRAEGLHKFLAKGSKLGIEGRIQTRKWQDKEGHDRYSTEIVAENVELLGEKKGARSQGASNSEDFGGGGDSFGDDSDVPF